MNVAGGPPVPGGVRRTALALALAALAAPTAALAQYAYLYPPPPPPRPPAAAYLQTRFYLNLGLGYGGGSADVGPYSLSLRDWASPAPGYGEGAIAFHGEGGARLLRPLLLGFDVTGLSVFGTAPSGAGTGATVVDYDAVLTVFPVGDGLFLRGGAGLSSLLRSAYAPASGSTSAAYLGTNVLLGIGWAFPLGGPAHLTLGLDWSQQFFGAAAVHGSSFWAARVGFGWY